MAGSISDEFPKGNRRGPSAQRRLASAYEALFEGRGSKDDARMVLVDLGKESGFFSVMPLGTSSEALQRAEGARALYARIHNRVRMTADEKIWLETAVRNEVFTSIEEQRDKIGRA